jgi:hypothetical protein
LLFQRRKFMELQPVPVSELRGVEGGSALTFFGTIALVAGAAALGAATLGAGAAIALAVGGIAAGPGAVAGAALESAGGEQETKETKE